MGQAIAVRAGLQEMGIQSMRIRVSLTRQQRHPGFEVEFSLDSFTVCPLPVAAPQSRPDDKAFLNVYDRLAVQCRSRVRDRPF